MEELGRLEEYTEQRKAGAEAYGGHFEGGDPPCLMLLSQVDSPNLR